MAGFFQRLANRLWRAERHTQGLRTTIEMLVRQTMERGEQEKELVTIKTPLLPGGDDAVFVEFSLLRRSLVDKSEELQGLFTGSWGRHVKDFMVTASLPKPDGTRDLYFLAAYERPWQDLDTEDIRAGIIEGVAVGFHEDLETTMRRYVR